MTSAQPSSTFVVSNVPSMHVTRSSTVVLLNCARMPSLGSIARNCATASFQSGCASSARVKMPVPAPILARLRERRESGVGDVWGARGRGTYSTMVAGAVDGSAARMCARALAWYDGRALGRAGGQYTTPIGW